MVPRKHQEGAERKKQIDEAKFIEDLAKRHVAFSKRRNTLFSMAGDLSALCGVDTAVVTFSPSARATAYAFGSLSVDAVLQRLPTKNDGEGGAAALAIVDGEEATLEALRKELEDTKTRVKAEKARLTAVEAKVEQAKESAGTTLWWEADDNALGAAELPEYEAGLRQLRKAILSRVDSLPADQNGA
jgi:hypothetical protein